MAVVMEKRIIFTLNELRGLAFRCKSCQATLRVGEEFNVLKFQIGQPKTNQFHACEKSWIEGIKKESFGQEVFDNANKLLEALQFFRRNADDSIPWEVQLDLPGEPD